jgi:hypothetical protein
MADKIVEEVAKVEIDKWLEYKKIDDDEREAQAANIEKITKAIMHGRLVLNTDSMEFTQTLKFPITNDKIETLTYKPRIKMSEVQRRLQGVKGNDADGRVLAYISTLTGKQKPILQDMDSVDYDLAQAIAIFFL